MDEEAEAESQKLWEASLLVLREPEMPPRYYRKAARAARPEDRPRYRDDDGEFHARYLVEDDDEPRDLTEIFPG